MRFASLTALRMTWGGRGQCRAKTTAVQHVRRHTFYGRTRPGHLCARCACGSASRIQSEARALMFCLRTAHRLPRSFRRALALASALSLFLHRRHRLTARRRRLSRRRRLAIIRAAHGGDFRRCHRRLDAESNGDTKQSEHRGPQASTRWTTRPLPSLTHR